MIQPTTIDWNAALEAKYNNPNNATKKLEKRCAFKGTPNLGSMIDKYFSMGKP